MPIRQPLGISTPASSAASRIGRDAVGLDVGAGLVEGDGAALAGDDAGGAELLGEAAVSPRSAWCASSASSSPAGPQANVVRSSRSGTRSARSATSSTPCSSSYRATSRIAPAAPRPCRSSSEDRVAARWARRARRRCRRSRLRASRSTPLSVAGNRLRSMPMTGVMPEPAVTKSSLPRAGSGSTKSPAACSRWTSVPGRASRTRWLLTLPSGTALTVIEIRPSAARAVGQGVGAPLADAVDVDADPDVLAGHVAGPVGAGLDHDRGGVRGLGVGRPRSGRAGRRRGAAGWNRSRKSAGHQRRGRRLRQAADAASRRATAVAAVALAGRVMLMYSMLSVR